jgi:uncharacterized protein (TIGR03437 family)
VTLTSRLVPYLPLLLSLAEAADAQPVVNAVENNYSFVLPGLPNYGIAQGSIFVIFGDNLAVAPSGLQNVPLQTTLDGVSVQFNMQGTITQALMYYVLPNQVAGILPSATPIGTGTVIVTSGGQSSAPAPVVVVQSAFGIAAVQGPVSQALAFDANWRPLGPSNAANPADTIVLYGSGAGPVSADESVLQIPENLSNSPLEVDIGGVAATVAYHGRSVYPGLDQVNVVVPAGSVGCNVSVVARSGNIVSNFVFIPVATGSRVCSDQVPGVTFGPAESIQGTNSVSVGTLTLANTFSSSPAIKTPGSSIPAEILQSVTGDADFIQSALSPSGGEIGAGLGLSAVLPSIGECAVGAVLLPPPTQGPAQVVLAPVTVQSTHLNAGPAINFTGPNGKAAAPLQAPGGGDYSGTLQAAGPNPPQFIPSAGGLFTIDNGSGGPDVGPFTFQINVPPLLVWTNMSSITAIDRSQDLTITWNGGNPNGFISIMGNSNVVSATQAIIASFSCSAPVAAQQFTIPSSVLLALPPQPVKTGEFSPALQISGQTNFLFSAPGLDGGIISAQAVSFLAVTYQ